MSSPTNTNTNDTNETCELESGFSCGDKIVSSEDVIPVAVVVVETSPIQLSPPCEQVKVKMLNVAAIEVNPVPKPQRTFNTPNGSQNSLLDPEKSIPLSNNNITPEEVSVIVEEDSADVNVNIDPNNSKTDSDTEGKRELKPLMYKKSVDFIPPPFPTPQTPRANSMVGKRLDGLEMYQEEEFVMTAYLALFFVCFNIFWSIGLAVWHSKSDRFWECTATTVIILISAILVGISFFCNSKIPKAQVWKGSKIVSFLTVVPCLLPIVLGISNIVFATKELRNSNYQRAWTNTNAVFLVESLTLALPQCVLQLCILMEDSDSIPSAKGFFLMFGIFVMSHSVTFFRIRYDSNTKPGFMEHGVNKAIKYGVFWAHKILWILTLSCVIVGFRLCFKSHIFWATIGGVVVLLLIYEIPVVLSLINRFSAYFTGGGDDFFFLLPQFTSLTFLIFWINMDPNIYDTNIGSIVLGMYFWIEMVIMCAWIVASGKETNDSDYITTYPQFFGSLFAALK